MLSGSSIPECAVCLQTCVHPAQLPCGHIFCFLCVKGVANQSKKCAMCRQEIPTDYFEKPVLLAQSNTDKDSTTFDDGYQWFYEGRNGKY
jgi:E3 ubiquitin-protein ligase RNF146